MVKHSSKKVCPPKADETRCTLLCAGTRADSYPAASVFFTVRIITAATL